MRQAMQLCRQTPQPRHSRCLIIFPSLTPPLHPSTPTPSSVCQVMELLKSGGVLASNMGGGVLRLVTHLDVGSEQIDRACTALAALAPAAAAAAASSQ